MHDHDALTDSHAAPRSCGGRGSLAAMHVPCASADTAVCTCTCSMETMCRSHHTARDGRRWSTCSECKITTNQYVPINHVLCRLHTSANRRLRSIAYRTSGCLHGDADGVIQWSHTSHRYTTHLASPSFWRARLFDMLTEGWSGTGGAGDGQYNNA